MFSKLRLRNFKAWKGDHTVELRPLTLVLGVNSAGKSSLLQPLLLLKQTVESPDRLQALNLGGQPGDLLDLGSYRGIVAGHDPDARPDAGLGFRLTFGPVTAGLQPNRKTFASVEYEVDYGVDMGVPFVERMVYITDDGYYSAAHLEGGRYRLSAPKLEAPDDIRTLRTHEPERSVGFSLDAIRALGDEGPVAQDLALALTQELRQLAYLGPHRVVPGRFHSWTGRSPGHVGATGEHAVSALIGNLVGRHADASERGRLLKEVSSWFQRLGVAERLDVISGDGGHQYQVVVANHRHEENLLDVGFGVSQVLPVVTVACLAPRGSTVILSDPELHLHPLAQSVLGDLLVSAARERGVQFLVETHSEHLFRRLQTLIAEEKITPDECSLLFASREDGVSSLRPLEVDKYGRIANWPPKFFGDMAGEVEQQTRKTFERKRAEKAKSGG